MASIVNMMQLSTGHAPSQYPDFGGYRVATHEYGWVIFVTNGKLDCPAWLKPIMKQAIKSECILINFDADADLHSKFKKYDW